MKFADVTNDIAFRKIFGNENKKISLISFLNAVINFPNDNKVIDVDILNPYQLSKLSSGKATIVDVKAKDKSGNTFIVEMQIAESDYFHKRVLYYTSQSYTSQIDKGKLYNKLYPVYFIGILDFKIGHNPNYFSCHKVLDVETNEQVIQDVEFNFIEVPKFNKSLEELVTPIDQWTYFIKNAENLEVIPADVKDEGLKEAYLGADRHTWTQEELDNYERASIKEQDELGRIALAEKRAEERAKMQSQIEIAKNMKADNEPMEKIMKYTGLSEEEIKTL
jgi:predicted transposase/invertase (TIGR01784 family)